MVNAIITTDYWELLLAVMEQAVVIHVQVCAPKSRGASSLFLSTYHQGFEPLRKFQSFCGVFNNANLS